MLPTKVYLPGDSPPSARNQNQERCNPFLFGSHQRREVNRWLTTVIASVFRTRHLLISGLKANITEQAFVNQIRASVAPLLISPDEEHLSKVYREDKWRILRYQDVYRGRNGAKFHIGRCSFLLDLPEDLEFSPNGGPGTGSLPSVYLPPVRADAVTSPGVVVVQAIPQHFLTSLGTMREIGSIRGIPRDRTGAAAGCIKAAFDLQLTDLPDVLSLYTLRHTAGKSAHGVQELFLNVYLHGTRRDNNARAPLGFPNSIGTTVPRELYGIPVQYGASSSVFQTAPPDPSLLTLLPTATISGVMPANGSRSSVAQVWSELADDQGIPLASIRSLWIERGPLRAPHKKEAAFDTITFILRGDNYPDCPAPLMDRFPLAQYHVRADLGGPRTATLSLYQDIRRELGGPAARQPAPSMVLPQRSRSWRALEVPAIQDPGAASLPLDIAPTPASASTAAAQYDEDLLKTIRQLRKENTELKARQTEIREKLDSVSERHKQEYTEAQAHRRREVELQKLSDQFSAVVSRQASFEKTVQDRLSRLESLIRKVFDFSDTLSEQDQDQEGHFSGLDSESDGSFLHSSFGAGKGKKHSVRFNSSKAGTSGQKPGTNVLGNYWIGRGTEQTAQVTSSRAVQHAGRGVGLGAPSAATTSSSDGGTSGNTRREKT